MSVWRRTHLSVDSQYFIWSCIHITFLLVGTWEDVRRVLKSTFPIVSVIDVIYVICFRYHLCFKFHFSNVFRGLKFKVSITPILTRIGVSVLDCPIKSIRVPFRRRYSRFCCRMLNHRDGSLFFLKFLVFRGTSDIKDVISDVNIVSMSPTISRQRLRRLLCGIIYVRVSPGWNHTKC